MNRHDAIVVGAGIAGLQCARRLSSAGADVLVLDRADKPGGRCATRTFNGQPADYGPVFLHGDEKGFLDALAAVEGTRIEGWPRAVHGNGQPCQPDAFARFETRVAFVEGVNAFPRSLAAGLPVQLRSLVTAIARNRSSFVVTASPGRMFEADTLVMALALEQSIPLLSMLGPNDALRGVLGALELFASRPCLALLAGFEKAAPIPSWDISYPEDEPALLLVSNESSKRPQTGDRILLFQASSRWSRQRLEMANETWARELLAVAARRLGAWAGAPRWTYPHRWRFSRLDRANELARPISMEMGKARLGIAGDLYWPGGGVQAAWMSGDQLGARLAT